MSFHRVGADLEAALCPAVGPEASSGELDGFQIFVGADDLAQPIFVRTIAPVGVGMETLHEVLVPRRDGRCTPAVSSSPSWYRAL